MNSIGFVNIHGGPWNPSAEAVTKKAAKRPDQPDGYHKGFRVVGHPPGSMEEVRKEREDEIARRKGQGFAFNKIPHEFNEQDWRMNGKKSPIQSKPYELREAADLCAEMARKTGWTEVDVVELKKEARNPAQGV